MIKRIWIEGNTKTKERIIFRELNLEPDQTYARAALDSMFEWERNRVYNTNLFNTVEVALVNEQDGAAEVKITVDERWYFYPVPFLRLIDRNISDWWVNRDRDLSRINYGITATQFNFRGRREVLRVILQSGFTTGFAVGYSVPNLDKNQNHGLVVNTSYSFARNVAFTTREGIPRFTFDSEETLRRLHFNRISHTYRSSFYTFHTTTFGHRNVSIADTLAILNPNYLGEARTRQGHFFVGHSFRYDKRNNNNYATSGARVFVGLFKHGLGIYKDGVDFWRARLRMSKYWDFGNRFYAASDVSVLSTFPARRDYNNYYEIGLLLETLRGYDLNVVEGSSYVIQRNEFKHLLFSRQYNISNAMPIKQFQTFPVNIYWKIFYDQGYAKGYPDYNGSEPFSDRYLYSYGTGIDFLLVNDLTVRLELSRNTFNQTNFFVNFLALL